MESTNAAALELRRVASHEWVVYDLQYPMDDSRCLVACLSETEDDLVEVVWLQGTTLPVLYRSPTEVLEDLVRHRNAGLRLRRPDEIPHRPPFSERGHRPRVA
ncbi:hypothetical protein [Microbacterium sp. SSM24]|uniref:hypothetical protein n=1 Tax=Microbacterium sp. SSM24 TaxID=2991714 RepID=UPI00222695B5|nr:hypothetical protein [Microbacterium sp. SSM24]MCW3493617.1 hypothetical protein [Microbacterium sp. SSM24]